MLELHKERILDLTDGGLEVFDHFIENFPGLGKPFLSPFYPDTKPSAHVHRAQKTTLCRYVDFGDSTFNGDCFTFTGHLFGKDCQQSEDFKWILELINVELGLGLSSNQNVQPRKSIKNETRIEQLPKKQSQGDRPTLLLPYHPPKTKPFTDKDLLFWNQYGIDEATLKSFNVFSIEEFYGYSSKSNPPKPFTIRSSENNPVFGYVFPGYTKSYMPFSTSFRFAFAGTKDPDYCFGMDRLPKKGDLVFITGGEKDVLSLVAHKFSAVCFNSETARIPKDIVQKLSFRFKHIVLLYDVDETGRRESLKQQERLKEFEVKVLTLPLSGEKDQKDISDYFRLGNSAKGLKKLFMELLERFYATTMSLLKSFELDYHVPPPELSPIISIGDVPIGTQGNLLAITGPEGSGKSNFLGALLAGTLVGDHKEIDTLGTTVLPNLDQKAVLYYDTEQSDLQLYNNAWRIFRRANRKRVPDWFKTYGLVGMQRQDRLRTILHSMDQFYYKYGGIHLVIIDGIADLIAGVNDEDSSVQLVDEIFRLAAIYQCCIVLVLHLSPSGYKLRGHLGSEIQRKAAGIISIEKEPNSSFSVIKPLKVRTGSPLQIPELLFEWDEEKHYHVLHGEKPKTRYSEKKMSELKGFVMLLLKKEKHMLYRNLVKALSEEFKVTSSSSEKYIKALRDVGMLTALQGENGVYRLTE